MQGICAFIISRVLIAKNVEYMNKIHNYMYAMQSNVRNRKKSETHKKLFQTAKRVERGEKKGKAVCLNL